MSTFPNTNQAIFVTKGDTVIRSINKIMQSDNEPYIMGVRDYIVFTVRDLADYGRIPDRNLFQTRLTNADYDDDYALPFIIPAAVTNTWAVGDYCYDVKLFQVGENSETYENTVIKYSLLRVTTAVTGREVNIN